MSTNEQNTLSTGTFRVADWKVDPATGLVSRGEASTRLEPKAMEVLLCIARHPGKVVSRRELEDTVWSNVIVGPNALTGIINKLRKAFDDDPGQPSVIETLPKKGYRLIAPVSHDSGPEHDAVSIQPSTPTSTTRLRLAGLGTLVVTAVILAVWIISDKPASVADSLPHTDRPGYPTVAVLPFRNISGDTGQDYLADGITEDIITDLSRLSNILVISRTSVLGYRGSTVDTQKVSQDLNVRYVLTGSIQKSGNRLRIAAHLMDSNRKIQVWAERYDRNSGDVFDVQDEITRKIITAMVIRLSDQEQQQLGRRYTTSLEAHEYYMRGRTLYNSISKEGNNLAREMFRKAIAIDPGFSRALGALALTYVDDYRRKWDGDPKKSVERAVEIASKAVAIDQDAALAHWVLGYVYLYGKKQPFKAIASAKRALQLDPNFADAYALVASASSFIGRSEDAIRINKHAMRLNPNSSVVYQANLGRDYYFTSRLEKAVEHLTRAGQLNFNYLNGHIYLAAVYARMGKINEAKWEAEQVLALDPEFSLDYWARTQPYVSRARLEKMVTDLRSAGLPA